MDNTERTTGVGEHSTQTATQWMSLAQIQRRASILNRAELLARQLRCRPVVTSSDRFNSAMAYAALLTFRRCRYLLQAAEEQAKKMGGGAPVAPVCVELARAFNRLEAEEWVVLAQEAERLSAGEE